MLGRFRHQSIRNGLIGHWRPSRGCTGNLLLDSVGSNHGVLTFDPVWQASKDGLALRFDGNKYVSINGLFRRLQDHVTVSTWFLNTGNYTGYSTLYDAGALFNAGTRQLSCFLGGSNAQLYVALKGSAGASLNLSNTLELDRWTQLALTFDGSTITAYVDGIARGTATTGFGSSFTEYEMRLSSNPTGGGTFFSGFQDDFAVWSRALTAPEVLALYTGGRGALDQRLNVPVFRGYEASSGFNATLTTTDGADSLAATTIVAVSSSLARTDGSDSLAATSSVALAASLTRTDGSDTLSATASVASSASLATTDGSDTLAASTTLSISASLTTTDGADTAVMTATLGAQTSATLNATDGADLLSASASAAVSSTLAASDGSDLLLATGAVRISASLSITDGADVVTITATSGGSVLSGIYLGQVVAYTQTVVSNRTTVRAH